jgi:tRNA splicing endonuclease
MIAEIYYQDFFMNSMKDSNDLQLDESNAVYMDEIQSVNVTKEDVCNYIYKEFNVGELISTPEFQNKVMNQTFDGKHTSMSVGDYVKFEDGEIWMVDRVGWKTFQTTKK